MRALGVAAVLALASGACGVQQATTSRSSATATTPTVPQAHPQAIAPLAGQQPQMAAPSAPAGVSVGQSSGNLAQPASTASIEAALKQSGLTPSTTQATLTRDGLAIAPLGAPPAVQSVIAAANQIARLPYRYGGGHITYADNAYD